MTAIATTPFVRNVLFLDGIMGVVAGVAVTLGASLLAPLLNLPEALLFWGGAVLLPLGALLIWMSRRAALPRMAILDIAVINTLWVIATFGVMVAGMVQPNLLGVLFLTAQGLAVGLLAVLQWGIVRQPTGAVA